MNSSSPLLSLFPIARRARRLSFFAGIGALSLLAIAAGCSDDEKSPPGNNPQPDSGTPGPDGSTGGTEVLQGEITSNRTLTANKTWLLTGLVKVKPGATLTIEKGTTIKGENANKGILLVERGAKIDAVGTADEPIVFTSQAAEGFRKAGDWGGVIIAGNAQVNAKDGVALLEGVESGEYGGGANPKNDESSGRLRYIRIEYSGVAIGPNNEVNGLTFAGVGSGTEVDHIQVRHTLDDCFEFFGGTVNAKYLSCQYNQDDGLDWDYGYTGKIQFFVLQQDPNTPDDTNGFEGDNNASGTPDLPFSEPWISNVTLCGHGKEVAKTQFGMLLRRNTRAHIFNTIALGFEAGVDLAGSNTENHWNSGGLEIRSSIFFGSVGAGLSSEPLAYAETGTAAPDLNNDGNFSERDRLLDQAYKNSITDPGITGCFNANAPNFAPAASLTEKAAPPPNNGFFDTAATYVGAFKDAGDTWATTGSWAVWNEK